MGLASKLLDVNYHEISLSLESGSKLEKLFWEGGRPRREGYNFGKAKKSKYFPYSPKGEKIFKLKYI